MTHQDLVVKAEEAITAVFSDQSEDRSITRESLQSLSCFISDFLVTLDPDDDN